VREIPTGDEWIHELKWDGYRLIARCENSVVYLWSRTGRNWAKDFPSIGAAMARLPVESVIVDGEAVCLLEDGRPDFHALRSRTACRDARLLAYDLLGLNGEDLRKLPLHERRKRLADLLAGNDVVRGARSSVRATRDRERIALAAASNNLARLNKRDPGPQH
jgi:bifunctional non-homologous end joining protein LigD